MLGASRKAFTRKGPPSSDVNNEDKGERRVYQTEEAADAEALRPEGTQGI